MPRIYIMGISGSGKSTLARQLAAKYACEHIELDSIHHQPNWTPISDEAFAAALAPRLAADSWVVDGNYSQVTHLVMERTETLLLLDYPRSLVMRRVIARTLRRGLRREVLWNGNRESMWNLFKSNREDNIVLWAWSMHPYRHERNLEFEAQWRDQGRAVQRFETPQQTADWLGAI
jgi:adenylate kinase family enzyme